MVMGRRRREIVDYMRRVGSLEGTAGHFAVVPLVKRHWAMAMCLSFLCDIVSRYFFPKEGERTMKITIRRSASKAACVPVSAAKAFVAVSRTLRSQSVRWTERPLKSCRMVLASNEFCARVS